MVDDLDIHRAANELIDQHGDEAASHAAMKVAAMLETGDMDGRAVWLRILKAVKELLDKQRLGDRAVH